MSNVVMAMYSDLGAELPTTAFATDAMGPSEEDNGGYGVVTAQVDKATVVKCFEEGLLPGFTVCRLDGSFRGLSKPEHRIGQNVPFTRVPSELLAAEWFPLLWGRWDRADHITLGEGRAVVKLLALVSQDVRSHRHRLISLQDSRPICGSFAKGRSTSSALNRICRVRASYAVAAELQVLLPWVQSDKMPADWLSRQIHGLIADAEPSPRPQKCQRPERPQG